MAIQTTMLFKKAFPFLIIFLFAITTGLFAQRKHNQHYFIVTQKEGRRVVGKLTAINENSIVIAQRGSKKLASVSQTITFDNINKIKVLNDKGSTAFAIGTTAAVVGNIIFALTVESGLVAIAIGTGGSLGIVAIAAIIYDLAHPPLAKLTAGKDLINYQTVSETFKVYTENDGSNQN